MLTNTSMDQDSPLACLLVGQPTLRRTMKLAVLAALEQRTALRYTMPGMTSTETASYVNHHLNLVGRPDQLFTEDSLNLIHMTSRGYPRAVNNLALQALVAAFSAGKNLVDETATRSAVSEVVDRHRHPTDHQRHLTDHNAPPIQPAGRSAYRPSARPTPKPSAFSTPGHRRRCRAKMP